MRNLKTLIQKLNGVCHTSLEHSLSLSLEKGHQFLDIEHWILAFLNEPSCDFSLIVAFFGLQRESLIHELQQRLIKQETNTLRPAAFSTDLIQLLEKSWVVASLDYGCQKIRSGHVCIALLKLGSLRSVALSLSRRFHDLSLETLEKDFSTLVEESVEEEHEILEKNDEKSSASSQALDLYTLNLTDQARQGKIDTVLERDQEIKQLIDILMRRRQNNPILVGEAGVGKTAIVEGLALQIAQGDVPNPLKNIELRTLDLGLLQAGASVKGEFEKRLKNVIQEIKHYPHPVVLFVDEAHTLIGAGAQAGQGDAANLLKPALARGELRTIAATTWSEYKKYFEQDAALARRFQMVKVNEPSEESAMRMMRGVVQPLESHHKVKILEEAVQESVKLSSRYLSGRHLPDKSVSLLDTASGLVSLSLTEKPYKIRQLEQNFQALEMELHLLSREDHEMFVIEKRIQNLEKQKEELQEKIQNLYTQWEKEKELIQRIQQTYKQDALTSQDNRMKERNSLISLLKETQQDQPLVHLWVDQNVIAQVIADWTGIPVGKMLQNDIHTLLTLEEGMGQQIIGQPQALKAIAQSLQTAAAKLEDPQKPKGIFLFVGPSGTGKTETALMLAERFFGSKQSLTVINMSEFKEEHKVSLLLGAPPGYVGYGEGGILTEPVRQRPYSLILLDEIEKAHPGVHDIFYQIFDKGIVKDGQGRTVDFKNTIIILTSNLCSDLLMTKLPLKGMHNVLYQELLKTFKPSFLARLNIVPFFPLEKKSLLQIIDLQLNQIRQRVHDNYQMALEYSPQVMEFILKNCSLGDQGARALINFLAQRLLPELSLKFLEKGKKTFQKVTIDINSKDKFTYHFYG